VTLNEREVELGFRDTRFIFKVNSTSSTNYNFLKSRGAVLVVYFKKQSCLLL